MDLTKPDRKPRVMVAKIGLDGHGRGVYVVAHGLRQAGMEVIYTGLRQTPAAVARSAVQEGVDVIGVSSMVGAHLSIVRKLKKELEASNASEIPIIIGGIIPEEDYELLLAEGVRKIFPPGAQVKEMVHFIHSILEGPGWVSEVPGSLMGRGIERLNLTGSKCNQCGQIFFPVRRNCPRCMDEHSVEPVELSDRGALQSFVLASVAPAGYEVPHAQGYIDLYKEGPRIFSLLTDYGDGTRLKVGCEMGLKIIRRGVDAKNRVIVGYRFKPLP
ncbi:MAG: cobalamin-dependent protein [Pseudomonadota bacterium]